MTKRNRPSIRQIIEKHYKRWQEYTIPHIQMNQSYVKFERSEAIDDILWELCECGYINKDVVEQKESEGV